MYELVMCNRISNDILNIFYKMKYLSSLLIILNVAHTYSQSSTYEYPSKQSIENLTAFARMYGYVRYFHPSDEASRINWDRFAIYGTKVVERSQNSEGLKRNLEQVFLPIAPSLVIYNTGQQANFSMKNIIPNDTVRLKIVAWQYLGLELDTTTPYRSIRLNRTNKIRYSDTTTATSGVNDNFLRLSYTDPFQLFEKKPNIGEVIDKDIGGGLSCIIPLALYSDSLSTIPQADGKTFDELVSALHNEILERVSGNDLYTRLADIIICWNILQNFYPYFDVVPVDWKKALPEGLKDAYEDKTQYDFYRTLRKFIARLNDGHGWVSFSADSINNYRPPLSWELVEDQLVITAVLDESSTDIDVGNIVLEIDGIPANKVLEDEELYWSSATRQFREFKALRSLLFGRKDSEMKLKIQTTDKATRLVHVTRNLSQWDFFQRRRNLKPVVRSKKIDDNIYYLNLLELEMAGIDSLMPELQKAKSIICELRGHPTGNDEFISHLLKSKDTSSNWMRIPKIIYPDQENILGFQNYGWNKEPKEPHLNAKIVYITDGTAGSYAESHLSFIEHYKLAEIVGQPTAGTNGNPNSYSLPGGYTFRWTGMKVVKHDGSQLHGVGIKPTIPVHKTIRGVKENRDEFLEKAIEVVKGK